MTRAGAKTLVAEFRSRAALMVGSGQTLNCPSTRARCLDWFKSCGLALVVTVWLGRLCVLPTPGSLYLYSRAIPQQVWTPLVVKEGDSMSDMVGCRKLNVSDMQFSRLIKTPALGHCQSTSMSDM